MSSIANLTATNNFTCSRIVSNFTSSSAGTNIAIGTQTLNNNANNSQNIAIGYNALFYANSSANNNTALGQASLASVTSGTDNTCVGCGTTLRNLTTGSRNTAVGSYAFSSNTVAGTDNTFLGYNAGVNSGDYSFTTAIGSGATCTASNQIVLGRSAETVIVPGSLTVSGTFTASRPFSYCYGSSYSQSIASGYSSIPFNNSSTYNIVNGFTIYQYQIQFNLTGTFYFLITIQGYFQPQGNVNQACIIGISTTASPVITNNPLFTLALPGNGVNINFCYSWVLPLTNTNTFQFGYYQNGNGTVAVIFNTIVTQV